MPYLTLVPDLPTRSQEAATPCTGPEFMDLVRVGERIELGGFHNDGTHAGNLRWYVLDKQEDPGDLMRVLLISDDTWWTFDETGEPINVTFEGRSWSQSKARAWCQGFERDVLAGLPGLTVVPVSLGDDGGWLPAQDSTSRATRHRLKETPATSESVFFLSAWEVLHYCPRPANRTVYDNYWTRSATEPDKNGEVHIGIVCGEVSGRSRGLLDICPYWSGAQSTARPAFWARLGKEARLRPAGGGLWVSER